MELSWFLSQSAIQELLNPYCSFLFPKLASDFKHPGLPSHLKLHIEIHKLKEFGSIMSPWKRNISPGQSLSVKNPRFTSARVNHFETQ